jgi:hypothetical protein
MLAGAAALPVDFDRKGIAEFSASGTISMLVIGDQTVLNFRLSPFRQQGAIRCVQFYCG